MGIEIGGSLIYLQNSQHKPKFKFNRQRASSYRTAAILKRMPMCDKGKSSPHPERPRNASGNLVDIPKSFLGLATTPAYGLRFVIS